MKYICEICNKKHGILSETEGLLPIELSQLIDSNSNRVIEAEGMYLLDKNRTYLNATLSIPTEYSVDFNYTTWIYCNANEFLEMSKSFENSKGSKILGRLSTDLFPIYKNTENLNCEIIYKPNMNSDERPKIIVKEQSELLSDQINGMSKKRFHKIMSKIYHVKW